LKAIMAIIKIKAVFNFNKIHIITHGYRTTAPILGSAGLK